MIIYVRGSFTFFFLRRSFTFLINPFKYKYLILTQSSLGLPCAPRYLTLKPFLLLHLHCHRPAKILLLTKTPSFQSSACASMSTQTHHVRDTIELTEVEQKIFNRLLATERHFKLKTDIRVAGGWVRDKVCTNSNLWIILFTNSLFTVTFFFFC